MNNPIPTAGELGQFRDISIFFGAGNFSEQTLTELGIENYRLMQVHGDQIVLPAKPHPIADGHWTVASAKALLIRSADCMPVFMTDGQCQMIMALHIGWRGLAKKIFRRGIEIFNQQGIQATNIHCWIGPHILHQSYSLPPADIDLISQGCGLALTDLRDQELIYPSPRQPGRFNISLQGILQVEAERLGLCSFSPSPTDTYRSLSHYSHRRYGFRQGLNYSFIIKN